MSTVDTSENSTITKIVCFKDLIIIITKNGKKLFIQPCTLGALRCEYTAGSLRLVQVTDV